MESIQLLGNRKQFGYPETLSGLEALPLSAALLGRQGLARVVKEELIAVKIVDHKQSIASFTGPPSYAGGSDHSAVL